MSRRGQFQKENNLASPSIVSKGKVEQFRNNFFKNISNHPQPIRDDKIQKRNYSAVKLIQKEDKSVVDIPRRQNKLRRQFDVRLGNIDKISSKIQDLLQYVKDKRYLDKNPNTNQEDSLEVMRTKQIQKIKFDLDQKRKNQSISTNCNKYTNVKANNQQSTESYSKYDGALIKNQEQSKYRRSNVDVSAKTAIKKNNLKKSQIPDHQNYVQKVETQEIGNRRDVRDMREKLNKQDSFILSYIKQIEQTKSANNILKTPQKYHERVQRYTPIKAIEPRQHNNPRIQGSIDEEIRKIKERIQQSQMERQKLTQRYTEYSQLHQKQRIKIVQSPKRIRMADENRKQTPRVQRRSFTMHKQTQQSKQFKIKLYPCQIEGENKQQTKLIADVLANQVHFDKKVKLAREEFSNFNNTQKWQILKEQLESRGITNLTIKNLEQQISISSEQHNPFQKDFSLSSVGCVTQLAQSYMESLNFWRDKVRKCASLKKLEDQGFSIKDLDLDRKGSLSIEDFVCFINLFSGNFFRNRDVMMLYRRFLKLQSAHKTSVDYHVFLEILTSN